MCQTYDNFQLLEKTCAHKNSFHAQMPLCKHKGILSYFHLPSVKNVTKHGGDVPHTNNIRLNYFYVMCIFMYYFL